MITETQPQLDTNEWSTITNALRVAAEQFDGYAKEFRKVTEENTSPNAMITPRGAYILAKRFDEQAKDCRELMDKIGEANGC